MTEGEKSVQCNTDMNELCIMQYSFKRECKAGLRDMKDRVRSSNPCLIRVS